MSRNAHKIKYSLRNLQYTSYLSYLYARKKLRIIKILKKFIEEWTGESISELAFL